jgi:uncharacterized protein YrrD
MQFSPGAIAVTVDDKEVGHLARMVIDPKTNEITHLVVRRGLLQGPDKVVPINAITTEREGQVSLHLRSEDLERLPDYEEEQYIRVAESDEDGSSPAVFFYPSYFTDVPGLDAVESQYTARRQLNIPPNAIALKEDAKVFTRDKQEVGHVVRVFARDGAEQVTHFVIQKGSAAQEQRLIPVGWVDWMADDEVYLAIESRIVDRLPVIKGLSAHELEQAGEYRVLRQR